MLIDERHSLFAGDLEQVFDGVNDPAGVAEGRAAARDRIVRQRHVDEDGGDASPAGQTPLLPAAMLATCVPCEPGRVCDCRSSSVAGGTPRSLRRDDRGVEIGS